MAKVKCDIHPDEEVEELELTLQANFCSFSVTILAWSSRKLARQIMLPLATQYKIDKMYTVSKKRKSNMPKRGLKAAKSSYS